MTSMDTNNRRVVTTVSLFDRPREKGSMEWKSIGDVIREGQVGAYRVIQPKRVKLEVRPEAPHHQQFFILKLKHAR